jgi:hypothetical protein
MTDRASRYIHENIKVRTHDGRGKLASRADTGTVLVEEEWTWSEDESDNSKERRCPVDTHLP